MEQKSNQTERVENSDLENVEKVDNSVLENIEKIENSALENVKKVENSALEKNEKVNNQNNVILNIRKNDSDLNYTSNYTETDSDQNSQSTVHRRSIPSPNNYYRKSRRKSPVLNSNRLNLNIEEIFEVEKNQKRINTEKIVTSWTAEREKLVSEWIKE